MPSVWSDLDRPPLSAARLRHALVDGETWTQLSVVDRTGSTNADLAAAARAGAAPGRLLIAEQQDGGRGRLDRRWEAPPRAAVLASALLKPGPPLSSWPLIPLLTGLAAAEAVRAVAGLDATLKWPNDVLVGEDKLGGVLVERVEDYVVVGVGLNISLRAAELPVPTATSVLLAGGVPDRESLVKELFRALARRWVEWSAAGGASAAILPAYREICATIGRDVVVSLPGGGEMRGAVDAVNDAGQLVVVGADGTPAALSVGDVLHVRATG